MGSLDHIVSRSGIPCGHAFDGGVQPHGSSGSALAGLEHGLTGRSPEHVSSEWRDSVATGGPHFYASPYQRTYDPDPGVPASFEPFYLPYRADIPTPTRDRPLPPPLTPNVGPELRQVQYNDLLMTDQWFELAMHEVGPSADEPLGQPDRPQDHAARRPSVHQLVSQAEGQRQTDRAGDRQQGPA